MRLLLLLLLLQDPHDHAPRHGGILFMAPDGFHHLEGVLSPDGKFRLFLYDNYTRPLDAGAFSARLDERRFEPAPGGEYLIVQLDAPVRYPADLGVFVRFGDAEERFDFYFPAPDWQAPAPPSPGGPLSIPESEPAILAEMQRCGERLEALLARGAWNELYVPALDAKELALALEERAGRPVALAVKKIVRAAWLLDLHGDLGNRAEVESAYRLFREGLRELGDEAGR